MTTTNPKKSIEETYTKVSQLEHILLRPDTYIGSVEKQTQTMWVFDKETQALVLRPTMYVPGLYKIFDEILVNAADNKQRDPSMTRIEVDFDAAAGSIRVWNNGTGIPIAVHQEHGIYVPELVFGHLLTGSNFDDGEAKTTGGRNGYGAKLANIFSTRFVVETAGVGADGVARTYRQEFANNMTKRGEPIVAETKKKGGGGSFTCVTFYPDLARFGMDQLDADAVALLSKRVYDVAGTAAGKLAVSLNGARLEGVKDFKTYLGLYRGIEPPVAFERVNDRWEIGVGPSADGAFQQVSFVNSICTAKGGSHVDYIADQLTARLAASVKKKNKGEEVKPAHIKNHLAVYVNALIVNPAFDTQTKETLTTKAKAFGSVCAVSDKMMRQLEANGGAIVDRILSWSKFKQSAELAKKSGTKRSKLVGVPKLDDANCAGTAKSAQCTLILTEGDSAKALAVSGLGVVGRDYYGVFPLKGKLLNVREASHAQVLNNEEIQNIAKILGLTFGKTYTDTSSLRYGHLMIMADQDADGSHVKGLLINFLHHFWPSLLQIDGFLQQFITPIVKCARGKAEKTFFTIPQYQAWCAEMTPGSGSSGWTCKYYKGLGTSTAAEAKEYFSNLATHEIDFAWSERSNDAIDMAFAKKRVEDRKHWLLKMEPGTHIDYDVPQIAYDAFVDRELILFSQADNVRSIAHFMDGMKPSLRKVLFACFKRNLKQEIKVAQLAGYVSEHAAYHHGEVSLTQTIVGMAQNFVGSNNVNLLQPCGQFGTRLMGGKDAASPRYIFTKLETIARCVFHPHDDALLEYLEDDGVSIEPKFYMPVIPMALVNGSDGIGTGWSSTVPAYNPREIVANLRRMLRGEEPGDMVPWYRGFTGTIQAKESSGGSSFVTTGAIAKLDERTVLITELPVGKWTTDFKVALEAMMAGSEKAAPLVKDFKENHTDTTVRFTVTTTEPIDGVDACDLIKKFKLEGSVSINNMHMFDMDGRIRKFEGPMDVMKAFFPVRLEYYGKRKAYLAEKLTAEWDKLDNRVRFVTAVISGDLVVANRKKRDLEEDLRKRGFKADKTADDAEAVAAAAAADDEFDYLLSMKLWSLTAERVQELTRAREAKRAELDMLLATTATSLWQADLDRLELALDDFDAAADAEKNQENAARAKAQQDAKGNGGGKKRGGGGGGAVGAAGQQKKRKT